MCFGNSLYIATGQGRNTLAYSTNGTQWTGLGTTIFSLAGYNASYSSRLNIFVSVGAGVKNFQNTFQNLLR